MTGCMDRLARRRVDVVTDTYCGVCVQCAGQGRMDRLTRRRVDVVTETYCGVCVQCAGQGRMDRTAGRRVDIAKTELRAITSVDSVQLVPVTSPCPSALVSKARTPASKELL